MDGEYICSYSLNLTRINLNNSNTRRDELLSQRVGETAHCGLGSAVDASSNIRLSAGDTANIDDVSAAAVVFLLEDGEHGLGHVDQSGDICGDHNVDVCELDIGGLCNALDEATVTRSQYDSLIAFVALQLTRCLPRHQYPETPPAATGQSS